MAFTFEPISFIIGTVLVFVAWIIVVIVTKLLHRKDKKEKSSLATLKGYVKQSHNNMVDAANNLVKLYEVFNEIEMESKK